VVDGRGRRDRIVLFAVGANVVARIGATGLLVAAALGHIARWTLLANVTDPAPLFAIQILHGATFGALHLGSLQWIREHVEPGAVQRATTMSVAIGSGLALGAGLLAAGVLYERMQGAAYYAMAGLGLAGLLAAARLRRIRHESG
jgi:PPP family 3-phenylpropionic acid transporter